MPSHVLMTFSLPADFIAELESRYRLLGPLERMEPSALPPGSDAVRAMITKGGLPIDAALLDALPALELIICYGTGFDRIDLDAAAERGVRVTNAGDANASSVAEYATGLMLAGVRGIVAAHDYVRGERWQGNGFSALPLSPGLVGRRLGIYGLGEIGRRVASRAQAMEMEIGYCGRAPHADVAYRYLPSLEALAEWCDVLMVTVRAGAYNHHAVNREVMAALGSEGYLVNVSRGYVVDESALIEALEQGILGGAALDVFEHEPKVPEALKRSPRMLLSPHIAPLTHQAQGAQRQRALDNLAALDAGEPLSCLVR